MADDKTKQGKQDRIRVSGSEDYELRYEAKKEGVTKDEVKQAVDRAGPMREDVEKEIERKK